MPDTYRQPLQQSDQRERPGAFSIRDVIKRSTPTGQGLSALVENRLMRATAFLMRSIRQDSRLISHHVMRGAMAAMILYLLMIGYATYSTSAAAGADLASTVVQCCYWFLTFIGGIHFSTAIVEEKEEQTLALLKMTGASPFAILSGKSIPRLAMAVLFLCVIAPFLILSITLGGVLPLGLISAILGICCYSVMLSQMGLLASVICRSAPRAFSTTCVLWLAFELCGWWYWLAKQFTREVLRGTSFGMWCDYMLQDVLYWVPDCSLIGNLGDNLLAFATSDAMAADDWLLIRLWNLLGEVWHFHMGVQLTLAVVFFLLSWLLFERFTSRAVSEGAFGEARQVSVAVSRPRAWDDSIAWKSWQHVSGGRRWFWLRSAGATVLIVSAVVALLSLDSWLDVEAVAGMTMVFGIFFFLINTARLLGTVFNAEIHGKTLASLVMLPQKTSQTLWAMIVGLLPAIGAGAVCALIGFCLLMIQIIDSYRDFENLMELFGTPWFWHFFSWVFVTIHLGLLLTTYVRYGGMLIGFVLMWLVAPTCCGSMLSLLAMASGPTSFGSGLEDFFEYIVPLGLIMIEAVACLAMQRRILRRLEEIASQ